MGDRLGRTRAARLGWMVAIGLAIAAVAEASRLDVATVESGARFVARFARWAVWGCAGPIAWEIARSTRERDRSDGLEGLIRLSGAGSTIEVARILAAWRAALARTLVPVLLAGASGVAMIGVPAARAATGGVVAAVVASGILIGLALACGRITRERGRSLFAGVVLVPWAATAVVGGDLVVGLRWLVAVCTGVA